MRARWMIATFAVALAAPWAAGAADDGAKLVDEICGACHNAKVRPIEKMHLTREQWAEQVERMTGMGAEVPKKKIPELVEYLAKTYGPEGGDSAKK